MSISLVLTFFLIPFLFSIVWYDWFGFAQKRILINRLVSSVCLVCSADLILVQIPDVLRYLLGPFPSSFCFLHYVLKNTFALQQIMYADVISISRYIFIFWLKNPAMFPDDFWIKFTNIFIFSFSFFSQFAFACLPGPQSNIYYFCLGGIPNQTHEKAKKINVLMVFFQVGSVILLTFINLKIKRYKRNHPQTAIISNGNPPLKLENQALESVFLNLVLVVVITEVTYVINRINWISPFDNNLFPNYLYVNIFHLINPLIICGAVPIVYVYKNSNMKIFSVTTLEHLLN